MMRKLALTVFCLAASPALAQDFPVTVTSCDREVTFAKPPERAIATHSNLIEMMLALGLEEHLAGVIGAPERLAASADYYPAAAGLRSLQDQGMSMEVLLEEETDLVFSGWSYGLRVGGDITPESLGEYDIPVYELSESCIRLGQTNDPSFDYLFRDLANLGMIFGVPEHAAQLIDSFQARIDHVAAKVSALEAPPRVFVYDSGDRTPTTAGRYAMPQPIIEAAGGTNIAGDIQGNWIRTDWETVIDRNPEAIIIVDYGAVTAEEKIALIRDNPAFAAVPAVVNNRFIILGYDELTPGPRNINALEKLADFLLKG